MAFQFKDPSVPDKEIQVAKISARQAITVTVITALAGLLGVLATIYFRGDKPHSELVQRTLALPLRVIAPDSAKYSLRIVADVNGQYYSYPSRAIFADISDTMSVEKFLLPCNSESYSVSFTVFLRYPDGHIQQLSSNDSQSISVSKLPTEREYLLSGLDEGFTRGGNRLIVTYEIR
jgi:hypothetical protein